MSTQADFDVAGIDVVVNTHLHLDRCGGNHLFAGRPTYVQRRELEDARSEDDYTIREWVEAPGVRCVPVDGELELLPGLRLVPAPGHTRGSQVVVVETGGRPVVIGGDMAIFFSELDQPRTEGQRLVRALDPADLCGSRTRTSRGGRRPLSTSDASKRPRLRETIPLRDTEDSLEPHRTLAGSASPDASNPRLFGDSRARLGD